ncbi:MAG: glycosyl transferase group 1 [Phycisphaerales bacterium]|nr:glycosyl transferase group 1 [Phycisphaerales bacterium]
MRVLVVSHSCIVALNRRLFEAVAGLGDTEVELVVPATWRDEYTGSVRAADPADGSAVEINFVPVRLPGRGSFYHYAADLAALVRRAAPDVVFLDEEPWSLVSGQVARACRRAGVPLVCYTKQNLNKRYPPPFRWVEQSTYRAAAGIAALTEAAQDVLRQKGFAGPCPILPHGYDTTVFHPGPANDPLRRQLGLRGTVVGYLGRFIPVKGLHTLVEAASVLRACGDGGGGDAAGVTLLMVGAGPLEPALRADVARRGLESMVTFAGPVRHERAADYLRCMDALVLPSLTLPTAREQFGRVIIEAQACGVPVVGSTSGNIPGLIGQTRGGVTFREGDPADLAAALFTLVRDADARRALGRLGAETVRARFGLDAVAANLRDILRRAAGLSGDGGGVGSVAAAAAAEEGAAATRLSSREAADDADRREADARVVAVDSRNT